MAAPSKRTEAAAHANLPTGALAWFVQESLKDGRSFPWIARHLGVHRSTVRRWALAWDLPYERMRARTTDSL